MITARTGLVALLGEPVHHSLSPAMHNAAFAAAGLDLVYLAFAVGPQELGQGLLGLKALGFVGANVTAPHKAAVIPYLDRISPRAAALNAVNTIINRDGILVGENTDWIGCLKALQELLPVGSSSFRALILGSGGAARSAALAVALAGAGKLYIANRTHERALELKAMAGLEKVEVEIVPFMAADLIRAMQSCDLIVNCLPFDLEGETWQELYTAENWSGKYLLDLRYAPGGTSLVQRVSALGARAADGKEMLLYQGAEAFTLFTGVPAPLDVMRAALAKTGVM